MAKRPAATPDRQTPAAFLDDVLPLAVPTAVEVHARAAILEVADPAQLLELAADPLLQPFLLCRLAPNVALVDPGGAPGLAEALKRRGHTPKISKAP